MYACHHSGFIMPGRTKLVALFGVILLLTVIAISEAVIRGPNQLRRLLKSQNDRRIQPELLHAANFGPLVTENAYRDLSVTHNIRQG